MEEKIQRISILSPEQLVNEIVNSDGYNEFIDELSKLKLINKEMNKKLLEIFQKIKNKNDKTGNNFLYNILSNKKISKMLKAFPSKELTEIFNFIKKYGKKKEKNPKLDSNIQQEEIINENKIEITNYKNIVIETSIENLIDVKFPFNLNEIEKIPDKFNDIGTFIDFYFKKEYYDYYNSILDIYKIINSDENNLNINFYKNILITSLEVRCYGIFLNIEFEKIPNIKEKFNHENLLIISSLGSSYIFITEVYLNPYLTNNYSQLNYLTPPLKENYQKIKVKLLNTDVLKKLCLISNNIEFQMFELKNGLSLSKISLNTLQNLDTQKFPVQDNLEKIFFFEKQELNFEKTLEQIELSNYKSIKIYNLYMNNLDYLINFDKRENIKFTDFIKNILDKIETPLLIVSKNNKSINNLLLKISRNFKKLKIKKIIGSYNSIINSMKDLCINYHFLGFENKYFEEKLKNEWHYLKKSLSENRVNSRTLQKYAQSYFHMIIDDFYQILGKNKNEKNEIKIIECFLNEKNLKSVLQSEIKDDPEKYLSKFSTFLNSIKNNYKIKYLWERNDNYNLSTNEWKKSNYSYWMNQIKEEDDEDYENDFLFNSFDSDITEEKKEDINNLKNNNKNDYFEIENKNNEKVLKLKKNNIRKNYWLLNEKERNQLLKDIQDKIIEYDFNYHINLIKCINEFNKQEILYSSKYLKKENIIGMTIYNGIKMKEVIEKININTIIINNPQEISRSSLISLFHASIKNMIYLFSDY